MINSDPASTLSRPLSGTAHVIPVDLRQALTRTRGAFDAWQTLTPLARNEWICWVLSVKKEETRMEHIARMIKQLQEGKRRPCCWIGCVHRTDKAISPSVQGILARRSGTAMKKPLKRV